MVQIPHITLFPEQNQLYMNVSSHPPVSHSIQSISIHTTLNPGLGDYLKHIFGIIEL